MPLDEEGAKWSCEPCIRGHRSSKCEHFDRMMIKVPKAGRPLAKCPHPKGSCECKKTYALMVRIQKGSGCVCRPLYTVPASSSDSDRSTPASAPAIASPSPGRVQKSGRRQSHMQAAPESLARALDSMPDQFKQEDGISSTYMANLPSHQSSNSNQNSSAGSCCSSTPAVATPKSTTDRWNTEGLKWKNLLQMQDGKAWPTPSASTSGPYMSFGISSTSHPAYMNNYNATTSMPATPFPGLVNGLGISDPAMNPFTTSSSNSSFDPASLFNGEGCGTECQCGDDCQCLGCSAHPFNDATRERVQEMGVLMIDGQGPSPTPPAWPPVYSGEYFSPVNEVPPNFYQPNPYIDQPYGNPQPSVNGYSPSIADGPQTSGLMHPAEYHTLEYPVGISCSDVTGSCQCGSDCSCIGCLTHTGHVGSDAKTPFEELAQQPDQQDPAPASCCGPPSTRGPAPFTSMI